jgi:hypothetical protein
MIICDVAHERGTPPVTIRWTVDGDRIAIADDQTTLTWACSDGQTVSVKVVLTDALNASGQHTEGVTCDGFGQ